MTPAAPLLLLLGCIAHQSGLVQRDGEQVSLLTEHGKRIRLRLPTEEVRPVARLQDHLVELEGIRGPRGLRVTDFKVHEGLHGLTAWVGVLEPLGSQVAIRDRTSGAAYVLVSDSAEALRPFLFKPVLLEGYVEGPHQVRVLYYRVLEDEP